MQPKAFKHSGDASEVNSKDNMQFYYNKFNKLPKVTYVRVFHKIIARIVSTKVGPYSL